MLTGMRFIIVKILRRCVFLGCLLLASVSSGNAQPDRPLTFVIPTFARESLDIGKAGTGDLPYLGNIFDALIGTDPSGELSPARGLAESWETGGDGRSLTLRLREGVTWHDGLPLTTDDIVFTFERLRAPDANCTFCRFLQSIEAVEAIDPRTLRITLKEIDPTFFAALSSRDGDVRVLARRNFRRMPDGGFELNGNPIGTGPWRFQSFERGVEMRFTANATYWDQTRIPQFAAMRIVARGQPTTRLAMVRSGEADAAHIDLRGAAEAESAGLRLLSLRSAAISTLSFMGCWQQEMLCHNTEFRRAMVLAIDFNAIRNRIYPRSTIGEVVANAVWTSIALGFDPALQPPEFNPTESRRILQRLRYDNRPVKIWSVQTNGSPETPEIMQLVDGYLRAAGFRTELTPMEIGAFRPRFATNPQNFETRYAAHLHIDTPSPRPTVISNLAVSFIGQNNGGFIQAYWDLPTIDADYARLRSITNMRTLDEELRKLNRRIAGEYAFVAIVARNNTLAVGPRIGSWSPGDFGFAWHLETLARAR
jgi:peptide/nickel transport system substrate-binding protein